MDSLQRYSKPFDVVINVCISFTIAWSANIDAIYGLFLHKFLSHPPLILEMPLVFYHKFPKCSSSFIFNSKNATDWLASSIEPLDMKSNVRRLGGITARWKAWCIYAWYKRSIKDVLNQPYKGKLINDSLLSGNGFDSSLLMFHWIFWFMIAFHNSMRNKL